ncbi:MAG: hypothetical protein ACAH21_19185 [Ramlibacter sp.]|nr:hypothetical protein [Ramlibacter sp.]
MKELLNVAAGLAAGVLAVCLLDEARAQFMKRHRAAVSGPAADARLRDRVLACVDERVSHPRAVEVEVTDGVVRVSGQVPAGELDPLLLRLTGLRGVRKVHNALSTSGDLGA